MGTAPAIIWFRKDLRLADNPALHAALATGRAVLPVFVLDESDGRPLGAASRWWLHHSLNSLSTAVAAHGARLLLRRGDAADVIPALAAETGAASVHFNRDFDPPAMAKERRVADALKRRGIAVTTPNASLLFAPGTVTTATGEPFKVFTPFWRRCRAQPAPPTPLPTPDRLPVVDPRRDGDQLDAWGLRPRAPDWAGGLRDLWGGETDRAGAPGETGAHERLADFLDHAINRYHTDRDRPGIDATSRLSPHLRWGEISPRQIWYTISQRRLRARSADLAPINDAATDKFLAELGWREFSYHLLAHFPDLASANWRAEFNAFPWRDDSRGFAAWRQGRTGYPIVDAGMRELWHSGWMHNRVRMVAASFLVKDLLVDWRRGEAWFWGTLVDADPASNAAGWQWVAGCGADAAPFFRVFNPVLQGEKFDPDGAYVRHWLPELARLPARYIHRPWTAPDSVLGQAGVRLGHDYPHPIVDHGRARERALAAFRTIKKEPA